MHNYLVVLKNGQLNLLLLMFNFLRSRVIFLLPFLRPPSEAEDEMKGGLFLDVIIAQRPPILELLSGKDKPLLIWGDSFLVLDFCLDILDRVTRLDLKSDGLAREGFHEDLHLHSVSTICTQLHKREKIKNLLDTNQISTTTPTTVSPTRWKTKIRCTYPNPYSFLGCNFSPKNNSPDSNLLNLLKGKKE